MSRVYSFSVKTAEAEELIENLKAECDRKKLNFSAVLVGIIKENIDAKNRRAAKGRNSKRAPA